MPVQHRTGVFSFADFLELVAEDQKADLLDGGIYMASPESLYHNDLIFWLATILRLFVEEHGLGRVTVNRVAYRLTADTAPEPDIAFVAANRLHLLRFGYVDGPPDVAIEIISAESVDRDYEHKRAKYEAAGVGEYWIIDPDEKSVLFLRHDGSAFVEVPLDGTVFRSQRIPGFWLDTAWLWQQPLPATRGVVGRILGEPS